MKKLNARFAVLALVSLVIAVAIAGCGSDDSPNTTTKPAVTDTAGATDSSDSSTPVSTVNTTLDEWSIKSDAPVAKTGSVAFTADNVGKVPHELVVLKTDTPAADLPVKDGEVSEDDSVGEIPDLGPGKSGKDSIDLKAGKYVLVCNLPGHYEQGMYTSLEVK
ncbi:MAG: hypothetical protein JHC98_01595 [Thermoleophilaceae bacterium]|nr:hypothetical protein [Thermoleophilaceae bacterium]